MQRINSILLTIPLSFMTILWSIVLLVGLIPVWLCYTFKGVLRKGWESISPGITDGTILDLDE